MVNYAVDSWISNVGSLSEVKDMLETELETIDEANTIRLMDIYSVGGQFQAVLITDA